MRGLARALAEAGIAELDGDYDVRNRAVWRAVGLAAREGFDVGVRVDPDEPAWPVVYIELPTGQVSWHMPEHEPWDGHAVDEKWRRCQNFIREVDGV